MIVNTTRITVHPDKQGEFLQTIKRLIDPIKNAKGCRAFRFYLDTADENSSLIIGEWETELDLTNHLRSNDFAILRGAITVLSTGCTQFQALVTDRPVRRTHLMRVDRNPV